MEFYRRDLARMQYERGISLESIAAEAKTTTEEIMNWVREFQQAEAQLAFYGHQYERCKVCGEEIGPNQEGIREGSDHYPLACWRKRTFGA
jgi:hypothetical protein